LNSAITNFKEVFDMKYRLTFCAVCVLLAGMLCAGQLFAAGPVTLVTSIRGLDNPYHANYAVGAKALGALLKLPVDVLSTEGNSQKGISDVRAEVAKTGANMVLSIDPNQAPDVVPIAKILEDAKVYWVNWWNKPDDVKVTSYKYWVANITFDSVGTGYFNATQLFKAFKTPGKGKIIALQGQLANNAAVGRFQGLQKALKENPGVELVQWEAGDWDRTKGYNLTKSMLVAHPNVDGIWSANDDMAMGALQALKEKGLNGKVPLTGTDGIPEMFDAIKAGYATSTVMQDAKYQSQLGLSMALAAKAGKLNVASMPANHRSFMIPGTQVTRENVDKVVNDFIKNTPIYDLSDFFSRWVAEAP
jgi:ribose transport system substrate-binding protein